ncbi:MAG: HPr(Ser) kinase/phosphatase [bacterium]
MPNTKFLTIKKLIEERKDYLEIALISGKSGLLNKIRKTRIQRPGLALSGYMDKMDPQRIQVLGSTELAYLDSLEAERRREILATITRFPLCCILITKGLDPPPELLELSEQRGIPIIQSVLQSSILIRRLTYYLEEELAEEMSVHGSLLDIFGLGVLILGKSGIGKSECALDLLDRGHQVVADDIVRISLWPPDTLIGSGYDLTRYHLEIRGIGIIDVRALFGVASVRKKSKVELAIVLDEWKKTEEENRTGLEENTTEFLGVQIPMIRMPLAPGRNMGVIIEVAVRNFFLKKEGINSAMVLDRQVKMNSVKKRSAGKGRIGRV